jgi:hypothetical protein
MQQLESVRTPEPQPAAAQAQQSQNTADFWFLQQGAHGGQHQSATQIADALTPTAASAPLEENYTTFHGPSIVTPNTQQVTSPVLAENAFANKAVNEQAEQALLAKVHKSHDASQNPFGHIKTIMPLSEGPAAAPPAAQQASPQPAAAPTYPQPQVPPTAQTTPQAYADPSSQIPPIPPVTPPVNPAIMNLAHNDDLDVATLARQAEKNQNPSDGEVVISLR